MKRVFVSVSVRGRIGKDVEGGGGGEKRAANF